MTQPLLTRSQSTAAGYVVFGALFLLQIQLLYLATGSGPPPFLHADKVVHCLMFTLPAVVAGVLRSRALVSILLVHALVSEPAQRLLTTGRQMDFWDAVADLAGIGLGLAIVHVVRRIKGASWTLT